MKSVVVVLADGFEELEAVSVIDILRRAQVKVEVMGLSRQQVTGSRGITIVCDDTFDYYGALDYDGLVMVGGMQNAIALSQEDSVLKLIQEYDSQGKLVAGICATPALVFSEAGILNGRRATCYPSDSLMAHMDCEFEDSSCVVDGNLITSQSPDTAMEFALTLVEELGYNASQIYKELQGK